MMIAVHLRPLTHVPTVGAADVVDIFVQTRIRKGQLAAHAGAG